MTEALTSSSLTGLGGPEHGGGSISHRREVFGANVFQQVPTEGFFSILFGNLQDPTLVLLMAAALVSGLAAFIYPNTSVRSTCPAVLRRLFNCRYPLCWERLLSRRGSSRGGPRAWLSGWQLQWSALWVTPMHMTATHCCLVVTTICANPANVAVQDAARSCTCHT